MLSFLIFFFFNDTATTEIYTLSLHDALPIFRGEQRVGGQVALTLGRAGEGEHGAVAAQEVFGGGERLEQRAGDRKSTRLNSSHANISYAVFCLKKKNIR